MSHGFSMKSRAPRRIASTAFSTLPHAVITTVGQRGVERLELRDQLESLAAGGGVARVVEVEQHGVEVGGLDGREHAGGRGGGLDVVALALEQQAERLADVGLVVRDEDVGGGGGGYRHGRVTM